MLQHAVILVAHPDDETVLAGGVLALMASQGVHVHLISATRGEGGDLGEPPVAPRAAIGQARERELRCAAEALGITRVDFLDYRDPVIDQNEGLRAFDAPFNELARRIMAAISDADLVLTHGQNGEYGHPAHTLMHRATRQAVENLSARPLFYTVGASIPGQEHTLTNKDDNAHLVLDIRPWLNTKEKAALCHVSQHPLFLQGGKHDTVREALPKMEGYTRYYPPTDDMPVDAFADMLLAAGAWHPR